MILPDKHIRLSNSLIGTGAALLRMMETSQTVTELWDIAKEQGKIKTFDRFVSGLDLLFILGAVQFENGLITKSSEYVHRYRETDSAKKSNKTEVSTQ